MLKVLSGARRFLCAALAVLALCLSLTEAGAQVLQGRVAVKESGVPGAVVELHRVTRADAGVVATTTTDAAGRFRLPLPVADTSGFTVWFATTQYHGVRYFGAPLHPNDSPEDYTIAVYDTLMVVAAASPVRIVRRDIVLLPDPTGSWEVNEIFQIRNSVDRALVAPDGSPTWEFRIPSEATAFESSEGEAGDATIVRMDERVLLVAPLPPGDREVYVRYRLPATSSELQISVGSPTASLGVFVAQPAPRVHTVGLAEAEALQAEGRTFQRFDAANLDPGTSLAVQWSPAGPPIDPLHAALVVITLLLVVGAAAALSRRAQRTPPRAGSVAVPGVVRERRAEAELVP
jgi:hypothetical protein